MDEDDLIPFRVRAQQALCAAFEEITPANGYLSDLSEFTGTDGQPMKRVYRGRAYFGDNDPLPMVCVLEPPDDGEQLADPPILARSQSFDWNIIVQGFVADDKANPTDKAYALLADVRRRLAIERDRKDAIGRVADPLGLGGNRPHNRIEQLIFGAGIVRPPDEISAKAYFWLGVTLRVIEDPLLPFA